MSSPNNQTLPFPLLTLPQEFSVGAAIGGGEANTLHSGTTNAVVAGGKGNLIEGLSAFCTIAGGLSNSIGLEARAATIGGGSGNHIFPQATNATVAGGCANSLRAPAATIGGGSQNLIESEAINAVVSGGGHNEIADDGTYSTISGGGWNRIGSGAQFGTIAGGCSNSIGAECYFGFAAGHRAKANHSGAFVWSDGANFDFASNNGDEFAVRATGGVRFVTGVTPAGDPSAGVVLPPHGGSWSSLSDHDAKTGVQPVNCRALLENLARLPMATWSYKSQDASIRHIGPMAQDFSEAFQVGEDNKHITTVDADGVALAAVQGLYQIVQEKNARIAELEKRLEKVEQRLSNGHNH